MPVTATSTTVLAPGFTQATVTSTITTIMSSLGLTTFDTATGATNFLVYRFVVNAGAAKSTVFVAFGISNGANPILNCSISDNWNTTTKTATGQASSHSITLTSATQVQFRAFTSSELTFLTVILGSSLRADTLGYLRPASKPAWWDEATSLYAFGFACSSNYTGSDGTPSFTSSPVINACFPNPFSTTATRLFGWVGGPKYTVPFSPMQTTVLPKAVFFSNAGDVAGVTSPDLAAVFMPFGFSAGDQVVVTVGSEEYVLFNPAASNTTNSTSLPGYALRVI